MFKDRFEEYARKDWAYAPLAKAMAILNRNGAKPPNIKGFKKQWELEQLVFQANWARPSWEGWQPVRRKVMDALRDRDYVKLRECIPELMRLIFADASRRFEKDVLATATPRTREEWDIVLIGLESVGYVRSADAILPVLDS